MKFVRLGGLNYVNFMGRKKVGDTKDVATLTFFLVVTICYILCFLLMLDGKIYLGIYLLIIVMCQLA